MNQLKKDDYEWKAQLCPICGSAPTKFVGKRGGSAHVSGLGVECEIWKCVDCQLLFPDPMPFPLGGLSEHYDVDAEEYFAAHNTLERLQGVFALVQRAEELIGGTGRLLDIGVGRGEILAAASKSGWECEGVEPSSTFADHAEKSSGAKIWREPIERTSIPDNSFDVVILAAVLEHLYEPDTVIQRISRILRPGGLLFVDVPNESGLYFRVGNLYQRLRLRDWCVNLAPTFEPYHVFGFTPGALRKILSKYGLSPVDFRVYPGTSMVDGGSGLIRSVERVIAKAVTAASRFGQMGTYIETWARKSGERIV